MTRIFALILMLALTACGGNDPEPAFVPLGPEEINRKITQYSQVYDVPEDLIHRVVIRESRYNPAARNGP
jgi:soluble lytic murein transglycosylase-like protein